jgi:predicted phosphoribosyltransferase/dienelactone hydrolase
MMHFKNRLEAAELMVTDLRRLHVKNPLVLAIPRGAVQMGAAIAHRLGGDFDIVLVHKISSVWTPELSLGAASEEGDLILSHAAENLGVAKADLDLAGQCEIKKLKKSRAFYSPFREPIDPRGRTVIIVDDGIATGATMKAAVTLIKRKKPVEIIVAAPVASVEAVRELEAMGVSVSVLHLTPEIEDPRQFYLDFHEADDQEVASILSHARGAISITEDDISLKANVVVPAPVRGIIIFAHGTGSGRRSPRNQYVASVLQRAGFATVLVDLLDEHECVDQRKIFDIELLTERLSLVTRWVASQRSLLDLPLGYFGASTGAAAALRAAARLSGHVEAVVSRGGRPDLAQEELGLVDAPTLLIVGGHDDFVLELNRRAFSELRCEKEIVVVAEATHLFEEPGALERVAELASEWFTEHLAHVNAPVFRSPDSYLAAWF